MKFLNRHNITRCQNSDRVFARSFVNTAGRKLSHHCSARTVRESQKFGVPSRNIAFLARSKSLRTAREVRRWRPDPIRILLVTGFLAVLGVPLVILIPDIHPTPDKHTLEKDKAELASLETQSGMDHSHIAAQSLSLAGASSARVDAPPEELSQPGLPKSTLTASVASSVDGKTDTDSRAVRKHLKGRADNIRNPRRQTALAATRQQSNQRGLSSFFSAIGRALHLSSN